MNTRSIYLWMALIFLALGLGLASAYFLLDLSGFFGGMCAGAASVLLVLATYLFGRSIWWNRGKDRAGDGEWLPSRERNDWLPSRDRGGQL